MSLPDLPKYCPKCGSTRISRWFVKGEEVGLMKRLITHCDYCGETIGFELVKLY